MWIWADPSHRNLTFGNGGGFQMYGWHLDGTECDCKPLIVYVRLRQQYAPHENDIRIPTIYCSGQDPVLGLRPHWKFTSEVTTLWAVLWASRYICNWELITTLLSLARRPASLLIERWPTAKEGVGLNVYGDNSQQWNWCSNSNKTLFKVLKRFSIWCLWWWLSVDNESNVSAVANQGRWILIM